MRQFPPSLALKPIRWLLIKEEDGRLLQQAVEQQGFKAAKHYIRGASAQGIYYQPGTIHQSLRLLRSFARLGKDYPSASEAESVYRENQPGSSLYAFEAEDDTWFIRNVSPATFRPPFHDHDWQLFYATGKDWFRLSLHGTDVVPSLELLPLLNGSFGFDDILARTRESGPAKKLFIKLLEAGMVREVRDHPLVLSQLPELLFFGHASFAVRDGATIVAVDPLIHPKCEGRGLRRPFAILEAAAAILISHNHWDHLHYDTLIRVPRDKPIYVPKVPSPSFMNPPIGAYLKSFGFSQIIECEPWQEVNVGDIRIRLAPLYGEPFGLESRFDGLTYFIEFGQRTLFGSVDACHDETQGMDPVIEQVATWGRPDLYLFGCTDQCHNRPYAAASPRHFSNELKRRPDLVRYHPNADDVSRWATILEPGHMVPYAAFVFEGDDPKDVELGEEANALPTFDRFWDKLESATAIEWKQALMPLAGQPAIPMMPLHPMQGIRFSPS